MKSEGKRDRSQIGRSSKNKGNSFERKVASLLQDWWYPGFVFKRTPLSGGALSAKEFNVCGDVVSNDPRFPFVVECKHTKAISGLHNLLSPDSKLLQFWEQAKTQADQLVGFKYPLLVFRWNNSQIFCMYPISLWRKREDYNLSRVVNLYLPSLCLCMEPDPQSSNRADKFAHVSTLSDFLKYFDPNMVLS